MTSKTSTAATQSKTVATIELKDTITSLELVKQINVFRSKEGRVDILHKNLLAVIREEFEEEIRELKIKQMLEIRKLPQGGSAKYPYFELTLSQAKQVLVRESRYVRKAIIAYIEKLEAEIRKPKVALPNFEDPIEAAQAWIEAKKGEREDLHQVKELTVSITEADSIIVDARKEIKELDCKIEVMKPKVDFAEAITAVTDYMTTTEVAKTVGMSCVKLNNILYDENVQYKPRGSKCWYLYSKYDGKGYAKIHNDVHNNVRTATLKWSQTGREMIVNLLKKEGYIK